MAEKINLTFLGTGSAVPTPRRNHQSFLLQYKEENILIDCGEGTQRQFRKAELNPCRITKILITHWHGDHILGLPGLLQTLMLNNYNKTLQIYGPRNTKKFVEMLEKLFIKRGDLKIETHEVSSGKIIDEKEFCIEAKEIFHDAPTLAYNFIIKEKSRLDKNKMKKLNLPRSHLIADLLKGKKVKFGNKVIDGKKLIYKEPQRKIGIIPDTSFNKELINFVEDSDLLISEATYSQEEKETAKQYSHLTSEDAANIAKKAKVKKLILVHLSQRYDKCPEKILSEAKKIFKNTKVAEDFDKLEV